MPDLQVSVVPKFDGRAHSGWPHPGSIALEVDATDLDHRVFRIRERIPVNFGPLTLRYPQWIPGAHAPVGAIESLAGLRIASDRGAMSWQRDPFDVFSFRVSVPNDVGHLDVEFQFASPLNAAQGTLLVRSDILLVLWEKLVLYPAGYDARVIPITASLRLPEGWRSATALEPALAPDIEVSSVARFRTTSLQTLVDSPLIAGRNFSHMDLVSDAAGAVCLSIVSEEIEDLEIAPARLAAYRRMVQEACRLFGAPHCPQYQFLVAVAHDFVGGGIEHRRSSLNGVRTGYFNAWERHQEHADLLAHEFAHSWNGKFRVPTELAVSDFNTPTSGSLLWFYEGMTQYWGEVLTARSGLRCEEDARASLATCAAMCEEHKAGRTWRNLQDTTNQPVIAARRPTMSWPSWQRSLDYYKEGILFWLDADSTIRELTGGERSLDDVAERFFGSDHGMDEAKVYTFEDVVSALAGVAAYDWSRFLRSRLDSHSSDALLEGLERSGWRLVYRDQPSSFTKHVDEANGSVNLSHSLGVVLDKNALITDVIWNGAAFTAGALPGMTLIAINGRAYTESRVLQAIHDTRGRNATIELLVKHLDTYRTLEARDLCGLRYPHLERIDGTADMLADIFRPRAGR